MADSSALAGLLDRAGKVFSLAYRLGVDFKEDFDSRGRVVMTGDEPTRQRYRERINEFKEVALDMRDAVEHPPDGSAAVVEQLCKAGQVAEQLANTKESDILGLYPELNTVADYGYQAIKAARGVQRGPTILLQSSMNRRFRKHPPWLRLGTSFRQSKKSLPRFNRLASKYGTQKRSTPTATRQTLITTTQLYCECWRSAESQHPRYQTIVIIPRRP